MKASSKLFRCQYGEILEFTSLGPQATELIAEAVTAMELEATVEDLMWTIHAHPTLAEAARCFEQRVWAGDKRLNGLGT
jgi:pyruvate/2-oxoglutarate dehydrogenase complex dihydrolipoamide dehydrogenase (E3) component